MRIDCAVLLVVGVLSATACSSSRVVSTERIADVTIPGADPAQVSAACVALSQAFGCRVERADPGRLVVDTPREPTDAGTVRWNRITLHVERSADGGATLSGSTSVVEDAAADEPFHDAVRAR